MVFCQIFEQILKFIKNPILIGINSKFLHSIRTCINVLYASEKYKTGESSPSHFNNIFDEGPTKQAKQLTRN